MMFVPSDQPIRDAIVQDQNNQIIVAGAGSGKTTLIVDRYMQLLSRGIDPQKMVAITFTNQSADELKLRIADKHRQQFPDRPALPIATLPIATIHGFCNRIIQQHAYRFGYLPSFEVDHEHMQTRLQTCFSAALPKLHQQYPDLGLWKLLGWISMQQIFQWLLALHTKNLTLTPPPSHGQEMPDFAGAIHVLQAQCAHCQNDSDKLLLAITHWIEQVKRVDPLSPLSWSTVVDASIPSTARLGNQTNWGGKVPLQSARAALTQLLVHVQTLQEILRALIITDLAFLQDKLQGRYLRYIQEQQIVEPDDLLRYMLELLRDPLTWQQVAPQVDYIFVDEFQDTDPVQTEIVMRLIAQEFPDSDTWQDIRIENKLTVVGDPQQSIYRFRNASIETFFAAQDTITEQGGKTYDIMQNFRSDPPVIEFVNARFAEIAHFSPLQAKPSDQQAPVTILQTKDLPEDANLEQARQTDAYLITRFLRDFFSRPQAFSPKDCVLLLPTFSSVDVYEKSISPFFPVIKQRKSHHLHPFFAALLTVIDYFSQPQNPYHLLSLLRTPFFFHSLTQLQSSAKEQPLQLEQFAPAAWVELLNNLQAKFEQSPFYAIEQFVKEIHTHCTREEQSIAQWTLEQLFLYESNPPSQDLRTFLHQQFTQHFLPSHVTDNTIQVMTMHQSKGLEFPMVILAGLYTQASRGQTYYTDPGSGTAQISFPPFSSWLTTQGFEILKQQEKAALLEEKKRLLYVAATRAKHQLVVSKLAINARQKTYADLLWGPSLQKDFSD